MNFTKRLVLSNREYEQLLAALDSRSPSAALMSHRVHERRPLRMTDIPLCVCQPDGGRNYFRVYGRNVSRGGISVLHGGFLHKDSDCRVIFRTRDNELRAVSGVVRHCRLIERLSHEVGIQFVQEINPRQFLLPGGSDEAPATATAALPRKHAGTVLVVDSFEPDRRLLEHHLRQQHYRPLTASTSGEALDLVQSESVDLVLSGLDLLGEHGLYLVQRLRQLEFRKPILLTLADNHPDNLALVSQAGADDVLLKPVSPDLLAAQLDTRVGRLPSRGTLVSQVQGQPGMRDLVAQFVEHLRQLSRRLRRAYGADDLLAMRECCCRIKGSALNYGFPALTVAALRATAAIDRHGDRSEARVAVRQLLDCCDRVQSPARDGDAAGLGGLVPDLGTHPAA